MGWEARGTATELLQALIRNECVNDGTEESGHEVRSADLLADILQDVADVERFESLPGRTSVVARIEGTDADAPTLCLMGHTDVVPANADGWSRDPFAGELVDGEVWGRGAIDMLNLTSTMAVAFRDLARSGWRPKGTLVFLGVADEEAGGSHGAKWLVDNHWDAVGADYLLTEMGGWPLGGTEDPRVVAVNVAEKGIAWRRLRVRGTPGHGSAPFGADNAIVTAAEVVRRIASYQPRPIIGDLFRSWVDAQDYPDDLRDAILDPEHLLQSLKNMAAPQARACHARSHVTFSPNVVQGGQKTNIIPDTVDIEVDIRTLPGVSSSDVNDMIAEALGDLSDRVDVQSFNPAIEREASESSRGNVLWDAVSDATQVAYPGAQLAPGMIVGATDATFFRDRGTVAYGTGIFSPTVTLHDFASRFHGNDERIDVESLEMSVDFWTHIAQTICG